MKTELQKYKDFFAKFESAHIKDMWYAPDIRKSYVVIEDYFPWPLVSNKDTETAEKLNNQKVETMNKYYDDVKFELNGIVYHCVAKKKFEFEETIGTKNRDEFLEYCGMSKKTIERIKTRIFEKEIENEGCFRKMKGIFMKMLLGQPII